MLLLAGVPLTAVPVSAQTQECDIIVDHKNPGATVDALLGCAQGGVPPIPCVDESCPDPCDQVDCNPTVPCVDEPCPQPCSDPKPDCPDVLCDGDCSIPPSVPCVDEPCPDPPDVSVGALDDEVRWTTTYPQQVLLTDDSFPLTGGLHNQMDVPVLVTLEASVDTQDVCSVKSFATSSGAPQTRQHEYLLASNGSKDVNGVDISLLNDDSISFSIKMSVGNVAANCNVHLTAVVQGVNGEDVFLGEQSVSVGVVEPLPAEAALGSVTSECATHSLTTQPADDPIPVQAGDVDVWTKLAYPQRCHNDEWTSVAFRYRHEDDDADDWTNGTSANLGDPGTATAFQTVDLSKKGNYIFEVHAVYWASWWDWGAWDCLTAIATAVGTGALIIATGPTGAALYASVALAAGSAASVYPACDEQVTSRTDYEVLVEAKDQTSAEEKLFAVLPV